MTFFFAAHGYEKEARACQAAVAARKPEAAAAVTDEMARTFVIAGTPDECRRRVEQVWDVVDSFWLVPLIWGMTPERVGFYVQGIGETFYS